MKKILILLAVFSLYPTISNAYVAPDKILNALSKTCFDNLNDLDEISKIMTKWNASEGTPHQHEKKWRFLAGATSTDYIDISITSGINCVLDIPQAGNNEKDNEIFIKKFIKKFNTIKQENTAVSSSYGTHTYTLERKKEYFYVKVWQTNLGSLNIDVTPRSVFEINLNSYLDEMFKNVSKKAEKQDIQREREKMKNKFVKEWPKKSSLWFF